VLEAILIALQTFQVLFLALHDWVPLGGLNDVAAVRSEIPTRNLLVATLIQTSFFAMGLFFSISCYGRSYPAWLNYWLWISYITLFIGEIEAWWIPYLVRPDPKRAARYQKCSAKHTHSCRVAMKSCQTPRTFCFIWRPPPHCWFYFSDTWQPKNLPRPPAVGTRSKKSSKFLDEIYGIESD
jgi:hypothetical protein